MVISDTLLDRNEVTGVKLPLTELGRTPLNGSHIENPWPPVNAPNLVRFLFLLHNRRGWEPPRRFLSYLKEAKKIREKYGGETVEEGIRQAAKVSRHPFGFRFVEKIIKENGYGRRNLYETE